MFIVLSALNLIVLIGWRVAAPNWWATEPCEVGGQRGAEGRVLSDNFSLLHQYSLLINNLALITNQQPHNPINALAFDSFLLSGLAHPTNRMAKNGGFGIFRGKKGYYLFLIYKRNITNTI